MMSFEHLRTHYPDHIPAAFKEHDISLFLINRENATRVSLFYDYVSSLDFDALCAR